MSVSVPASAVDCGFPPAVVNASRGTHIQTTYLSDVTYTCLPGHFFHRDVFHKTITCDADGVWSPTDIKPCVRKSSSLNRTILNISLLPHDTQKKNIIWL